MTRSRRSSVQRYHDRVAPIYDHSYDDEFWRWHDALTWDYLKPYLPRDLRAPILDVGCGTGKWAVRLLQSGYSVTCLDVSVKMLDQARAKIEAESCSARAEFIQADLVDLSKVDRERFALVVAYGEPIGCSSDPIRALKEIGKVMIPGGVLSATFDNRLSAIEFYVEKGSPEDLAEFMRTGRTHWLTRNHDERFPVTTFDPQELDDVMSRCGFDVVSLMGKTVLPMRRHRELLADPAQARKWARLERKLSGRSSALCVAPHLQAACKKRTPNDS